MELQKNLIEDLNESDEDDYGFYMDDDFATESGDSESDWD